MLHAREIEQDRCAKMMTDQMKYGLIIFGMLVFVHISEEENGLVN